MINSVNGDSNWWWESEQIFPGQWFTLNVRQRYYNQKKVHNWNKERLIYQIFVDGVVQIEVENKSPVMWNNVTLTVGDDSGYTVAVGQYRNLTFISCPSR